MSDQSRNIAPVSADAPVHLGSPADMRNTVEWLMLTLKSVLQGKPVKDADEVLLHADLALQAYEATDQDKATYLAKYDDTPTAFAMKEIAEDGWNAAVAAGAARAASPGPLLAADNGSQGRPR